MSQQQAWEKMLVCQVPWARVRQMSPDRTVWATTLNKLGTTIIIIKKKKKSALALKRANMGKESAKLQQPERLWCWQVSFPLTLLEHKAAPATGKKGERKRHTRLQTTVIFSG